MKTAIVAWILLAASPVMAETVDGKTLRVIDGDTVALGAEHIRLLDIDAPETWQWHCEDEQAVGTLARERLSELLSAGAVVIERGPRLDRYGRTLARLTTPQGDVGAVLLREGLALHYEAGAKAKAARLAYWCSGRPADQ